MFWDKKIQIYTLETSKSQKTWHQCCVTWPNCLKNGKYQGVKKNCSLQIIKSLNQKINEPGVFLSDGELVLMANKDSNTPTVYVTKLSHTKLL